MWKSPMVIVATIAMALPTTSMAAAARVSCTSMQQLESLCAQLVDQLSLTSSLRQRAIDQGKHAECDIASAVCRVELTRKRQRYINDVESRKNLDWLAQEDAACGTMTNQICGEADAWLQQEINRIDDIFPANE